MTIPCRFATEEQVREAINDFGKALLAAGAGLGSQSADELITTDLKFFESNGLSVGIAQVEVASFNELAPRLPDLREALQKLREARNLAVAMVMVTDVRELATVGWLLWASCASLACCPMPTSTTIRWTRQVLSRARSSFYLNLRLRLFRKLCNGIG